MIEFELGFMIEFELGFMIEFELGFIIEFNLILKGNLFWIFVIVFIVKIRINLY